MKMNFLKKVFVVSSIALVCIAISSLPALFADDETPLKVIKKSWTVTKGGALDLSSCSGSIKATAASGDKLNVTININRYKPEVANALKLIEDAIKMKQEGNDVQIKMDCEEINENFKNVSVSFEVEIPSGYNSDLNTGGGSVSVSGLDANCKVNTGGGSVNVSKMKGDKIKVNTGGGSVDVKTISSGSVSVNTGGGSIEITDTAKAVNVSANTGGGSISVESLLGDSKLNTGGGSITVKSSNGKLSGNTGGGSINVNSAKGQTSLNTGGGSIELKNVEGSLSANTGGGHIEAEVITLTKEDKVSLCTGGGDIHLYISGNLPLTFDLKIEDNDDNHIVSDFPLKIEGDKHSDKIIGTGEINGGGALIKIRTSESDIYIHKK